MAPLSIEMLKQKHPSKRRNALVANVFYRIGFIEAWGRGILLMTEELKSSGLDEPTIELHAGGIQITFLKRINQSMEKTVGKTVGKLLDLLKENPSVTREELANLTGLSIRGGEYNLNSACQKTQTALFINNIVLKTYLNIFLV